MFTLTQALEKLSKGEITSVQLVELCLKNIEDKNKDFNAYLFIRDREQLLAEAKMADEERAAGLKKKLLGIPFALKDTFMAIGTPTTAGDTYLEGSMSEYNATIVQRLHDEGAILIGKTNMDSWGFGSSTENSAYGVTKNPYDITKVAGGSSGGAAAAIALNMCIFSIGEDTGGSIRNPASYCGVYGLKPTYGRVSRFGCIAYASSLDTIGVFANSAKDIEIIMDIIEGVDHHDMTIENFVGQKNQEKQKMKLAYSMDFIPEGIDGETKRIYLETIEKFKMIGYEAIEVSFSTFNSAIPTYYITAMSEASTNLARYQGTRYGSLSNKANSSGDFARLGIKTWEDLFTKSRTDGFTKEAKRRTLLGAYVLSEGYFDAYYKKAQKIRNKIRTEIDEVLKSSDFILSPVTPSSALKIGEKSTNPVEMYLEDIYTVTANLAGIPALSFPAGRDSDGMPIGMQIMGRKGDDNKLISIISKLPTKQD